MTEKSGSVWVTAPHGTISSKIFGCQEFASMGRASGCPKTRGIRTPIRTPLRGELIVPILPFSKHSTGYIMRNRLQQRCGGTRQ